MNINKLTNYLNLNFVINPNKNGALCIYQREGAEQKLIALIHCKAGEINWTIEYADENNEMTEGMANSLETAVMVFLAGHLSRQIEASRNKEFAHIMENYIERPTSEDLDPGKRIFFAAEKYIGGETVHVVFEAGRPNAIAQFDSAEEAETRAQELNK